MVGDIVHYVDQSDPFTIGRADPIADGGAETLVLTELLDPNPARVQSDFFGETETDVFDSGFGTGVTDDRRASFFAVSSSLAQVSSITPITGATPADLIADNVPVGAGYATILHINIEIPSPILPGVDTRTIEFASPLNNFFVMDRVGYADVVPLGSNEVTGGSVLGIRTTAGPSDEGASTFPTVVAPGANWLVYYLAVTEAREGDTFDANRWRITGSSIDVDAAIQDPVSGDFPVSEAGGFLLGYEVTTAGGTTTPRTFGLSNADGLTWRLWTFLMNATGGIFVTPT